MTMRQSDHQFKPINGVGSAPDRQNGDILLSAQVALQPLDTLNVQVIGRLIEQLCVISMEVPG